MGTAAECMNCHVLPSVELNLTKAKFIRGRVNSQQPVSRMFVYIFRRLDRSPFCFIRSILSKLEVSRKRLYMNYIYPGCMSYVVKYVLWNFHRRTNAIRYLKSRTNKRSRRIIWQIVVRMHRVEIVKIHINNCISYIVHRYIYIGWYIQNYLNNKHIKAHTI